MMSNDHISPLTWQLKLYENFPVSARALPQPFSHPCPQRPSTTSSPQSRRSKTQEYIRRSEHERRVTQTIVELTQRFELCLRTLTQRLQEASVKEGRVSEQHTEEQPLVFPPPLTNGEMLTFWRRTGSAQAPPRPPKKLPIKRRAHAEGRSTMIDNRSPDSGSSVGSLHRWGNEVPVSPQMLEQRTTTGNDSDRPASAKDTKVPLQSEQIGSRESQEAQVVVNQVVQSQFTLGTPKMDEKRATATVESLKIQELADQRAVKLQNLRMHISRLDAAALRLNACKNGHEKENALKKNLEKMKKAESRDDQAVSETTKPSHATLPLQKNLKVQATLESLGQVQEGMTSRITNSPTSPPDHERMSNGTATPPRQRDSLKFSTSADEILFRVEQPLNLVDEVATQSKAQAMNISSTFESQKMASLGLPGSEGMRAVSPALNRVERRRSVAPLPPPTAVPGPTPVERALRLATQLHTFGKSLQAKLKQRAALTSFLHQSLAAADATAVPGNTPLAPTALGTALSLRSSSVIFSTSQSPINESGSLSLSQQASTSGRQKQKELFSLLKLLPSQCLPPEFATEYVQSIDLLERKKEEAELVLGTRQDLYQLITSAKPEDNSQKLEALRSVVRNGILDSFADRSKEGGDLDSVAATQFGLPQTLIDEKQDHSPTEKLVGAFFSGRVAALRKSLAKDPEAMRREQTTKLYRRMFRDVRDVSLQNTIEDELTIYCYSRIKALAAKERALRSAFHNIQVSMSNISTFNAGLEVELTCQRCWNILSDPQLLAPCGNTFCFSCRRPFDEPGTSDTAAQAMIEAHFQALEGKTTIPECQCTTHDGYVPNNTVTGFADQFDDMQIATYQLEDNAIILKQLLSPCEVNRSGLEAFLKDSEKEVRVSRQKMSKGSVTVYTRRN